MTVLPQIRMTVDEFLAWADRQPGCYELANGIVHAMSPEGAGHAKEICGSGRPGCRNSSTWLALSHAAGRDDRTHR